MAGTWRRVSSWNTRGRPETVAGVPDAPARSGLAKHSEDGDGDNEADDGIGEGKSEGDTTSAEKHSQACQPVGAGVEPVSHERR